MTKIAKQKGTSKRLYYAAVTTRENAGTAGSPKERKNARNDFIITWVVKNTMHAHNYDSCESVFSRGEEGGGGEFNFSS